MNVDSIETNESIPVVKQPSAKPVESAMEDVASSEKSKEEHELTDFILNSSQRMLMTKFHDFLTNYEGRIGSRNSSERESFAQLLISKIKKHLNNVTTEKTSKKQQKITEQCMLAIANHVMLTAYMTTDGVFSTAYIESLVNTVFQYRVQRCKALQKIQEEEMDQKPPLIGFKCRIEIPSIFQTPLDISKINLSSSTGDLVKDVLFPLLHRIMFPVTPLSLRKASIWRSHISRILNYTICAVLAIKYSDHKDFNPILLAEMKKHNLPPWWCVVCFFNIYKLNDISFDPNPKTILPMIQKDYIYLHNEMLIKGSYFYLGLKKTDRQNFKLNVEMKRPPLFTDLNDFQWKYKKQYANGIFDEGWYDMKTKQCIRLTEEDKKDIVFPGEDQMVIHSTFSEDSTDGSIENSAAANDDDAISKFLLNTAENGLYIYEKLVVETVFEAQPLDRCLRYKRISKGKFQL